MPPKGRLTAFYFYLDAKVDELKQSGRTRVSTNEVMDYWRALSDAERKPWEDKAAEACDTYFRECTERAQEGEAEGEEEEPEDEGGDEGGDEGADGEELGEGADTALAFPLARVKRFIRASMESTKDVSKFGNEATFATVKSVETFLERCVWDAARVTQRKGRKTISFQDVVTSMRTHAIPEAMQFFVGARHAAPADARAHLARRHAHRHARRHARCHARRSLPPARGRL
jgi:histone H3/H4